MYTKDFNQIGKVDVVKAGGKGASLGEMTGAGIPVPPGFVVLATAFEKFLEETDLNVEIDAALESVNHKEMHTIEGASEKIHALILRAEIPRDIAEEIQKYFEKLGVKYVAVRSSATAEDSASAAWAGQLDSYLNTTEETLLENVKKCWASLFTPRAIFYRFEKDLHKQKISVAVVVQKMLESEKSGIAFSVHPVTEDKNQLIIEAGLGLGEAIVSGQITPDSYVVEKQPRRIIDKNIQTQLRGLYRAERGGNEWHDVPKTQGEKQVLPDKEILELSEIILKIENHYGFPCDIEWASENGNFYIVQSRPITTLTQANAGLTSKQEYKFMWGQKQSAMITEAMLSQILFAVNEDGEMTDSNVRETLFILTDGIFAHYMPSEVITDLESNSNRYANPKYRKILFDDINKHIKDFFDFCENIRNKDLTKLTNSELKEIFTFYQKFIVKTFHYFATSTPSGTSFLVKKIKEIINNKITDQNLANDYFISLSTPAEFDETMRERIDFLKIAKNTKVSNKDLENYARKYPALFFNTYDKERIIDFLKARLEQQRRSVFDPDEEMQKMKIHLEKVSKDHKLILAQFQDKELPIYSAMLQQGGLGRYRLKHVWSGGEYMCLDLIKELQKRMAIDFEAFIKTYMFSDIIHFLESGEKLSEQEVKDRRKCLVLHYCDKSIHRYIGEEALAHKDALIPVQDENQIPIKTIHGDIANKGIVRGRARVVFVEDLQQFIKDSAAFKLKEILVTTMTSPVMIPIIEKAAGIITDEGGICSHAAISAREFKVPCIVGTHGASSIIKTGNLIEVDANNGIVKILS